MIIDTEDPVTLSLLNPLERQILQNVADRLAMIAWQRMGWMGQAPAPLAPVEPPPAPIR